MSTRPGWGLGLVVLAALAALVASPVPDVAAETSSVEIAVDAVMELGGLPFFWSWPSVGGTFEATGAFEDEGDAYGSLWIASWWFGPYVSYWDLGLHGDDGSLFVRIHVQSGSWTVTGGTGAYASASGSGTSTCTTQTNPSQTVVYYAWTLTGSVGV